MAHEWRVKAFKSGNSVAIRIPKAVGIREGEEFVFLAHQDGSISFSRESDRKARFLKLYGSMSPGWMANGRDDGEQRDYDWNPPPSVAA